MSNHKSKNFSLEAGSALRRLLDLPVFAGMSADKFADIVGNTKLHFSKFTHGDVIAEKGSHCTDLICVITGSVKIIAGVEDGFYLSHTIEAPAVIYPEYLFGHCNSFPSRVLSNDGTGTVQIAKNDFTSLLMSDPVILFNYLNIVSTRAQLVESELNSYIHDSLSKSLVNLVKSITNKDSKDITIGTGKRQLNECFGLTTDDFISHAVELQRKGCAMFDFNRNQITITGRENILALG